MFNNFKILKSTKNKMINIQEIVDPEHKFVWATSYRDFCLKGRFALHFTQKDSITTPEGRRVVINELLLKVEYHRKTTIFHPKVIHYESNGYWVMWVSFGTIKDPTHFLLNREIN